MLERRHTTNSDTRGMFSKLTIVQFINVAIVVLVVNFDFVENDLWGFIPIFNGFYPDFTV